MKNLKWWYTFILLLHSIPYFALIAVGFLWLWEHPGGLWIWGGGSAVTLVSGTFLLRRIRSKNAAVPKPISHAPQRFTEADPDPDWPPQAMAAWEDVVRLAEQKRRSPPELGKAETYWKLFYEVIDTVAKQYHPKRSEPTLEIPAPQILRTVELVSRDLRQAIAQNVPGSHILTLGDFQRLRRWKTLGQRAWFLYRMLSFGLSPVSATIREVRGTAASQVLATSGTDFREWIVDFAVRKTGYYAIGLYGEHQTEEDREPQTHPTTLSVADAEFVAESQTHMEKQLAEEPIRVLVIGRRGSGKTSLVADLTGQTVAVPGVEHRRLSTIWDVCSPVQPFSASQSTSDTLLHTAAGSGNTTNGERILVVELPGYTSRDNSWKKTVDEVEQADIILIVCSAIAKNDEPETLWVKRFKEWTAEHPERHAPRLIIALTKAPLLADLEETASSSEELASQVRQRATQLRQNLQLDANVPILPTDVTASHTDGIHGEKGLFATVLESLADARRIRKYRCLRQQGSEGRFRRIARQLRSGIGLASSISSTILGNGVRKRTPWFRSGKKNSSPPDSDEEWQKPDRS